MECALPQTYTDIQAFLSLVDHYRRIIKEFACIAKPLHKYLSGDGIGKKSEPVTLTEEALHTSEMLKEVCIITSVLAFTDFEKPSLLETDLLKEGLGAVLLQKQANGCYHPVAYSSQMLTAHEWNYDSAKLEILALKWMITEHFKDYLPRKPFILQTNNNLLTYIMTTPNLDAMRHCWVELLPKYTFDIEYQKECDNAVVDVLSRITTRLNTETVKLILNGVSMGVAQQAGTHDPLVIKAGDEINKQTQERAVQALATWPRVELHVMDWATAQREDPVLQITLDWIADQRKGNLKKLLSEHIGSKEGCMILCAWQKLTIH